MINLRPVPVPTNRRDGEVHQFEFKGLEFSATINFDLNTGQALEVFFSTTHREGALLTAILSDACISISKHLRAGKTAAELVAMFGVERAEGMAIEDAPPSSPLGLIVRRAMEREAGLKAGRGQ